MFAVRPGATVYVKEAAVSDESMFDAPETEPESSVWNYNGQQ